MFSDKFEVGLGMRDSVDLSAHHLDFYGGSSSSDESMPQITKRFLKNDFISWVFRVKISSHESMVLAWLAEIYWAEMRRLNLELKRTMDMYM